MYSDKDISDLYEDLLTIGAAETPEEEARRINFQLRNLEFNTIKQVSDFLTQIGVRHTFFTLLIQGEKEEKFRSNWILVRGLTVFWERFHAGGSSMRQISMEEIIGFWRSENVTIWDFNHIETIEGLPYPENVF